MMKKNLQTAFSTRQYMRSKDFEIYYYSDLGLSPVDSHSHDYYEFYFFLEGNVNISINGTLHPVKPGDFLLIPPGTKHHPCILDKEKPYRRFVLWISKDYCSQLTSASTDYIYLMQYTLTAKHYVYHTEVITFNAIQSMIFRLIEETRNDRFGKESEISLQINTLILYLNRLGYEQNHKRTTTAEKSLYLNICNYVSDHLDADLSLEHLAQKFFVSKFYISHTFKDNIGISIHQYITKKRLHACRDAILGSTPISRVFELYGFKDYSSFYRAFKKEYGISPKDYKEMYQLSDDLHLSEPQS